MILQIAAELAYITLCGFHAMYRPAKLPNILLEIWRPGIDCSRHAAAPECSAKGTGLLQIKSKHFDRVPQYGLALSKPPHHFKSPDHSHHPVKYAAADHRVQVRADHNRLCILIAAGKVPMQIANCVHICLHPQLVHLRTKRIYDFIIGRRSAGSCDGVILVLPIVSVFVKPIAHYTHSLFSNWYNLFLTAPSAKINAQITPS